MNFLPTACVLYKCMHVYAHAIFGCCRLRASRVCCVAVPVDWCRGMPVVR